MAAELLKRPAQDASVRIINPIIEERQPVSKQNAVSKNEEPKPIKKQTKKVKTGWEMSARDALCINYVDKEL